MGKAYANRKKAEERNENDFYATPWSLTWELLKLDIIPKITDGHKTTILDPCCGNYDLCRWFENDYDVTAKSLEYGNDFFKDEYKENQFDFVIMNPPFDLFDDFIVKAKYIAKYVISIAKTDYFSCYQRLENGIWNNLSDVYIFNRKVDYQFPIFENGDLGVGSLTSGWFLWDKSYNECPRIHFIDIQKYAKLGGYKNWLKKLQKMNEETIFEI